MVMFEIEHLKYLITFFLYLNFIYHIVVDINSLGMHQKFKFFLGNKPHSLVNHPNQTKSLKHLRHPKYYEKITRYMFIYLLCLSMREWDFTKFRLKFKSLHINHSIKLAKIEQGACHTMALPYTLKGIFNAKEELWNLSPCKNIIFKQFSKTKILQNIITL
jgi:hypothetical protein